MKYLCIRILFWPRLTKKRILIVFQVYLASGKVSQCRTGNMFNLRILLFKGTKKIELSLHPFPLIGYFCIKGANKPQIMKGRIRDEMFNINFIVLYLYLSLSIPEMAGPNEY